MTKWIIALVAVLVAAGGFAAWQLLGNNKAPTSSSPVPLTSESKQQEPVAANPPEQPTKEASSKPILSLGLSLDSAIKKVNNAAISRNIDVIWELMHPDDKNRWQNKDEYAAIYNRLHPETIISSKVKSITDLPSWTHPITGRAYSNLKQVVVLDMVQGLSEPTETISYYQRVSDKWHFFSQLLSASDRLIIKGSAQPGPSYRELSKTPDKFTGQKAWYRGKIIQIQEDKSGAGFLLLAVTQDQYGYWDDNIYVIYTESTPALQDDIVTIHGIITGAVNYTSAAGYLITVPGMEAATIER